MPEWILSPTSQSVSYRYNNVRVLSILLRNNLTK